MAQMTIPIDTNVPPLDPYMTETPDENWVLCKRAIGWGDAYLPQFRRIIRAGEMWYLPKAELDARADWEEVTTEAIKTE